MSLSDFISRHTGKIALVVAAYFTGFGLYTYHLCNHVDRQEEIVNKMTQLKQAKDFCETKEKDLYERIRGNLQDLIQYVDPQQVKSFIDEKVTPLMVEFEETRIRCLPKYDAYAQEIPQLNELAKLEHDRAFNPFQ